MATLWRFHEGNVFSNIVCCAARYVPPPIATDDQYVISEGTALIVPVSKGLLANDTDANPGQVLTVVNVNPPSHGTLIVNGDGSFTYIPDPNYTGTDSFTYQVFDGTSYSNVATVTIDVTPGVPQDSDAWWVGRLAMHFVSVWL